MSQEIISEVQEYMIMYTFNLTQKLKKWNDGKLKYFKFNNKVQIFNEDSILITSKFLQNDKQLHSSNWGNEVKMGSVLITIEEMVSESTREISNLFKKDPTARQTDPIKPRDTHKITPLKDSTNKNSPSSLLKRRRVGLSKSRTPSKIGLGRQMNNDEQATQIVRKVIHEVNESKNGEIVPLGRKLVINRGPLVKESAHQYIHSDKDYEEERLIPSDEFLLLGPPTITPRKTPSKMSLKPQDQDRDQEQEQDREQERALDEVRWDDDSITRSNIKIQTSLKTMATPRQTPSKSIKRIGSSRNREFIKVSRPKIALSDISNHQIITRAPAIKHDDDLELDEIESQSQSDENDLDERKITQTETYNYKNYGRNKRIRVSDFDRL